MKTIYRGDSRYEKIKEQMDLLSITDVTTERQVRNGTIVWRLPMKGRGNTHIEYASFASGYVRNQGNQCHSNWQINKRVMSEYEYYPDYEWCDKAQKSIKTGKFNRFKSKKCVPIPIEIDRLEYMMKYVIKNDFIKRANMIHTDFVPKWKYDMVKENADFHEKRSDEYMNKFANVAPDGTKEVILIIDGHKYRVI